MKNTRKSDILLENRNSLSSCSTFVGQIRLSSRSFFTSFKPPTWEKSLSPAEYNCTFCNDKMFRVFKAHSKWSGFIMTSFSNSSLYASKTVFCIRLNKSWITNPSVFLANSLKSMPFIWNLFRKCINSFVRSFCKKRISTVFFPVWLTTYFVQIF